MNDSGYTLVGGAAQLHVMHISRNSMLIMVGHFCIQYGYLLAYEDTIESVAMKKRAAHWVADLIVKVAIAQGELANHRIYKQMRLPADRMSLIVTVRHASSIELGFGQ